jgi:glyoxylase-like metal-dependent hydrolase (beta-lactamase superfamily II)
MTTTNNAEPLDNNEWEVHPLDVGQASGNLVITPNGESVLIDTDKEQVVEALDEVMDGRTAADRTDPKTIDRLVTTHIHADHVAGIRHLNDAGYSIEETHQPNASRYDVGDEDGRVQPKVFQGYLEALSDHGIDLQDINQHTSSDEIFHEDDVSLTALSPPALKILMGH